MTDSGLGIPIITIAAFLAGIFYNAILANRALQRIARALEEKP